MKAENNMIKGIIGALIGTLLGAIIWIIIYKLGYIAGIAGFAMGYFALKGYEKLGGALDKKAVIITIIILVVSVFLANYTAWALEAYNGLKASGWTLADCFKHLMYILKEVGYTRSFYSDLVVGYLLTALATVRMYINVFKALKNPALKQEQNNKVK